MTNNINAGFINGFCLTDAPYFSNIGDPPATRMLRNGVSVLGQYTEALLILAQGTEIEEVKAHLKSIGAELAGTLAVLPGMHAEALLIARILNELDILLEEAIKAQNYEELKRLTIAAGPGILRLIETLKVATPSIFRFLIYTYSSKEIKPKQTQNNTALAKEVVGKVEAYRLAISNFVVLLDEMKEANKEIVASLQKAEEAPLTMAQLANRA